MTPLNFGLFVEHQPPTVFAGMTRLDLTPMAARLLAKLAAAPKPVARRDLIGTAGGVKTADTLRVHLCAIRKVLPRELALEYLPEREAYQLATR